MKKSLVLALALALFAAPAFAGSIAGTAHDLSSSGSNAFKGSSDEICVYCHTPHGAGAVNNAPLWNRSVTNLASNAEVYNNAYSLDHVTDYTKYNTSDAILCLSCHDGSSLSGGTLNNPPNAGGGNPSVEITNAGAKQANLGDLSNDHPVAFVYDINAGSETELKTPASPVSVAFGAGSDEMWCSSCHDVHDNDFSPFLVMSNTGSALCLECHVK